MLSLSLHCCCTPQEAFFQSGFQYDREFFVNLAQELETGQACAGPGMEVGREVIKVTNTGTQRGAGAESSGMFAMGPSRPFYLYLYLNICAIKLLFQQWLSSILNSKICQK